MKYNKIRQAVFVNRRNRFVAEVEIDGAIEVVHVKNTGRCKEILIPGCIVILTEGENPNRKTKYDLIAAYKEEFGLINIDSQAPNQIVKEWLLAQDYSFIKPEYTYGESRLDFYLEREKEKILMEVKGCTLEIDGQGYFPDAPTERGVKHLRELTKAVPLGYRCILTFVIQMEGITSVKPCVDIHPEFGVALMEAKAAGVEIWFLTCEVKEDEVVVKELLIE